MVKYKDCKTTRWSFMNSMSFFTPPDKSDPVYQKLSFLCREFRVQGEIIIYRYIPSGHINTSYYVALYDGREVRQYLVQMVNWYVFREPVSMMRNIDLLTQHIMKKEKTIERRRRLHFHHTAEGKNYRILEENGTKEFWRLFNYVEHSTSFETADGDENVLRMAGLAFGRFVNQLADFDTDLLVESIPHFHDTRYRMNTFFVDVEADVMGRAEEAAAEITLIRENRAFACTLCEMIDRGELPIRVTHNDTKTNNVLFDKVTLDPLVIIDLDTCMPGLACYDFGDTIRFAACTGTEDQTEGNELDLKLFRAYAEGYLKGVDGILTENEVKSLVLGACIITLELASRFLDDYLIGDKYFRIDYPTQNLDRTRSQLSLFKSMMAHREEMEAIIAEMTREKGELCRL